jgi:amino acid permease
MDWFVSLINNIIKTKLSSIVFSISIAFTSMITMATIALIRGKGSGKPKAVVISGLPNLFGVCVYSFMCHHSLPALITPIRDKKRLFTLIFTDYILILVFYSLLSFTGIFTFNNLKDIYTLNFQVEK